MILWYPMIQREFQLELWTRKLLKSLYNTTLCDYLLQLMISAWMKVLALLLFSSFSTKSTWIKHFILNVLVFFFSDIFVFLWALEFWTRKSLYYTTLYDYLLQVMRSAWKKVMALLLFHHFQLIQLE